MQSQQRRLMPDSTYASQAARWKKGFKTPTQQQPQSIQQQTDLENALVSELCSSVGSSSFPPREVLQKLLRYLHTLDHDYICELLDDKFENPLWQVKAKALSVLSALLSSGDADFYKQYYSGRLDMLEDLCNAGKDMLRKRAEKVHVLLKDYATLNRETPLELMRRMQEEEAEEVEAREPPDMHTLMHTSPIVTSQQTPHDVMMDLNNPPHCCSAPLSTSAVQGGSAFTFLEQAGPQKCIPARGDEPLTPPVGNSAFGFLSSNDGEVDLAINDHLESARPLPSAPSLLMKQMNSASTAANTSVFAFEGDQQQQPKVALALAPTQAPRRLTVFDTLPDPKISRSSQMNEHKRGEEKAEERRFVDPIHDAFEGMDANDGIQALEAFDVYNPSSNMVHGRCENEALQAVHSTTPLREVILEIEVPPGPMGIMLDRTIPDMTVIERFVPLPLGGRGYLELHPAICPGCALISIDSIYVENMGLAEVGPILGSLVDAPKLLRFKKLMTQDQTANPMTLQVPYIPPPLEVGKCSTTAVHRHDAQPESQDTEKISDSEAFMTRLHEFNSSLAKIEMKLKELIGGPHVVDRRSQLAQLHGTVEKIQTQGIDSVILGKHRLPNYEEVKQFRLTLVRRADDLARLIQSTASTDQPSPNSNVTLSDEEKHSLSAFAFVGRGDSNSTVNDPPLGISQLHGDSSFHFLNGNTNPQMADIHGGNVIVSPPPSVPANGSYGFSFLRNGAQPHREATAAAPLSVSQAPTSPSSSFGVLSTGSAKSMDRAPNVFAGLSLKEKTHNQLPMFAGLSLKDDNQPEPDRSAQALCDTLTKSSHGRPMGLHDLKASLRSTAALARPVMGSYSVGQSLTITEPTQSSFAFMSAANAAAFENSPTSTEPSSPTAFGFMQDTNSSSTTPTVASSTVSKSQSQRSALQGPEPSVFSFISN